MKLRRRMTVIGISALVLGFTTASALAVSISATTTVNGSGGPVTVKYHTTAKTYGQVSYDSNVGPIPLPVDGYFEQGIAYYPFNRPVAAGGTRLGPYYLAVSGPTRQQAWIQTAQFWVVGTRTESATATAYAALRTGSSIYFNYTGTGTCGCLVEAEDFVRVYVS